MRRAKQWWQNKETTDNIKLTNIDRVLGGEHFYVDDNGRDIGLIVPKNAVDAITFQPIKEDQTLVDFNHESAFDRYYTLDSFNRLLRMAGNNPLMVKSPSTGQPIDVSTIQPAKARRFFKKGGVVRK